MGFKHQVEDVLADYCPGEILNNNGGSPEWYDELSKLKELSDFKPVTQQGSVARNWNYVVSMITNFLKQLPKTNKPLSEFKVRIPLPEDITFLEYLKVKSIYRDYTSRLAKAFETEDTDKINQTVRAIEIVGLILNHREKSIAWHISHSNGDGIASFCYHLDPIWLLNQITYDNIPMNVVQVPSNSIKITQRYVARLVKHSYKVMEKGDYERFLASANQDKPTLRPKYEISNINYDELVRDELYMDNVLASFA